MSTGRTTCVKHIPASFKSLPIFINRATCVAHDKNLSTCRLNVLETDKNPTLSRICKFVYRSLTNSTLSQRERVKCPAFTLAETLITLGIIGIVAALTIAPLVQKYRIKQLEVAFKRSSSLIQQALNDTAQEFGYSNMKEFGDSCGFPSNDSQERTKYRNCRLKTINNILPQINEYYISKFQIIKSINWNKWMAIPQFSNLKYRNFKGIEQQGGYSSIYGFDRNSVYILNDGSLITPMIFLRHEEFDGITLSFDTNGPFKGPNRYGYGIFIYNSGTHGLNRACNDTWSYGCYQYALKNENPDDKTKGYWDSLKF